MLNQNSFVKLLFLFFFSIIRKVYPKQNCQYVVLVSRRIQILHAPGAGTKVQN